MPRLIPALLLALPVALAAQTSEPPVRYVAAAINPNTAGAGTIEIVVNRWSTNAERDKLMDVVMHQSPETLLDVLRDMPRIGYLRTPDSIGWDLRFARSIPQPDGGEHVVLGTDRRIGFWEAVNRPRSIDYPFTVLELRLGAGGGGEGKMSLATRIVADPENNFITLEHYDLQPVMLSNVRREKVSR